MLRQYISVILALSLAICSISLSCSSKIDNFTVRDLVITPSEAVAGESILFEFQMINRGNRGVLTTWTLEIDGEEIQSKRIRAEEFATTGANFSATVEGVGKHTVVIYSEGNQSISGTFTLTGP
ncbi:hypothetical protein ACFLYQ_04340 [Chloroflexota bacterium]